MLHWIQAHPAEAIAIAVAVLSAVNGVLPHSPRAAAASRALAVLLAVLDRLALLTRADSPGTVKAPLVASRAPNGARSVGPPAAVVAVLLALSVTVAGCGAHPRQVLRSSKVLADGAASSFSAAYQGAALRCRGEMLRLGPGPERLRLYTGCMARWEDAADRVAAALDTLGAAQRAALAAIEVWEAGGERAPVSEVLGRVGRLVGEMAALVEQLSTGRVPPGPSPPPASQPASRPAVWS